MCLITNQSEPFIAPHDIECYKMLECCTRTMYETPCVHSIVLFKNGICIQQCNKFGIKSYEKGEQRIYEGIHSMDCDYNPRYSFYCSKIAIIPKGTKYFVGENNDLVSLKLIIFKNKFRYWIYKIFHK